MTWMTRTLTSLFVIFCACDGPHLERLLPMDQPQTDGPPSGYKLKIENLIADKLVGLPGMWQISATQDANSLTFAGYGKVLNLTDAELRDWFPKLSSLNFIERISNERPIEFKALKKMRTCDLIDVEYAATNTSGVVYVSFTMKPCTMVEVTPVLIVPNSAAGTATKLKTRTGETTGTIRTAPGLESADASRTAVSYDGAFALITNRALYGSSPGRAGVVLYAGSPGDCRGPRSSKDASPLPWGMDECVLGFLDLSWQNPLLGVPQGAVTMPRAVAWDPKVDPNTGLPVRAYIGLYEANKIVVVKVNPAEAFDKTLQIESVFDLIDLNQPAERVRPYGMVWARDGAFWVVSVGVPGLMRIEPPTMVRPTHAVTYHPLAQNCTYGITADAWGQVYVAGANCVARRKVTDPMKSWEYVNLPLGDGARGVAVSPVGGAWVADSAHGGFYVVPEAAWMKAAQPTFYPLPPNAEPVGTAFDTDWKPWIIGKGTSMAYRVDNPLMPMGFRVGDGPYAYSDMAGVQLGQVAAPKVYTYRFMSGCAEHGELTRWHLTRWTLSAVGPAQVVRVRVRGGQTKQRLYSAAWKELPAPRPGETEAALRGNEWPEANSQPRLLQVELTLQGGASPPPMISSAGAAFFCQPILP